MQGKTRLEKTRSGSTDSTSRRGAAIVLVTPVTHDSAQPLMITGRTSSAFPIGSIAVVDYPTSRACMTDSPRMTCDPRARKGSQRDATPHDWRRLPRRVADRHTRSDWWRRILRQTIKYIGPPAAPSEGNQSEAPRNASTSLALPHAATIRRPVTGLAGHRRLRNLEPATPRDQERLPPKARPAPGLTLLAMKSSRWPRISPDLRPCAVSFVSPWRGCPQDLERLSLPQG